LSGDESSDTSSPFTRMVAGRPTLSSRSDALRVDHEGNGRLEVEGRLSGLRCFRHEVHPEEELAELDGLGVLHEHLPYHARDFDSIHS